MAFGGTAAAFGGVHGSMAAVGGRRRRSVVGGVRWRRSAFTAVGDTSIAKF
jgi:hypothetical protein